MALPDFKLERYFARWEFAAPHLLSTSDVEGYAMRELASLYAGVSPEEVLVFGGAEEAIYVFMRATLGPGDRVVATWPGYQSLYEVARAAGAEVDLLPLHAEEGWTLLDHPDGHFRTGFGRTDMPAALERFDRWLERRFGPPQ